MAALRRLRLCRLAALRRLSRLLHMVLAAFLRLLAWRVHALVTALLRLPMWRPRIVMIGPPWLTHLPRPLQWRLSLRVRSRNSDACLLLGTLHRQVLLVLRLTFLALRDHLLLIQVHPLGFLILEHLFI